MRSDEKSGLYRVKQHDTYSIERANIRAAFTTRNAAAPGTTNVSVEVISATLRNSPGIPEEVEDMIFHPANIVASKLK